jgi:hypothetical protein
MTEFDKYVMIGFALTCGYLLAKSLYEIVFNVLKDLFL